MHYLDTSALVKRYLPERGSSWIASICDDDSIALSALTIPEFASVISRRARDGMLTPSQRDRLFQAFLADRSSYVVVALHHQTLQLAANLILTLPPSIPLRTLDAIHVICAQTAFATAQHTPVPQGSFISADRRLLAAATWVGLRTANPEDYA